ATARRGQKFGIALVKGRIFQDKQDVRFNPELQVAHGQENPRGLPPIIFGLFHLIGLRVFATIVPHWMGFGHFWAGSTGLAFILAGAAICSGIQDILAARLLALMLLLFEGLVEAP